MKVDGLDIDGVESVLTEENRATCIMGRVEAIREKLVVNIFGRLQQGRVMPPSDILFEDIFSPTGSGVPVVGAESPLHNRTGRKVFIGTVHVRGSSRFSFRCLAKFWCGLLNIHHMLVQDLAVAHFDP